MFVWASLPLGFDTAELLTTAIAKSVAYVPGAPFYPATPESNTMRLSFTTYPPAQIAEGTRRLATVFAEAGST
jgi:2-aminoadipate transaminase